MGTASCRNVLCTCEARQNCHLRNLRNHLTGVNLQQRCVQQTIISPDSWGCNPSIVIAPTNMLRARNCQGQAVGQQSTCWLLGRNHSVLSYVSRQHNRHNHSCIHGQCVLQRSSPSSRGQQQLAGRCVGQFATRVAAAASTGSTSYSTNASSAAAPQHCIQHPVSPQVYPSTAAAGQGAVTVTWPGLLAALGLAAAALVAAATTCFFLYIKPVMQVC
jgi:hypothetical protein